MELRCEAVNPTVIYRALLTALQQTHPEHLREYRREERREREDRKKPIAPIAAAVGSARAENQVEVCDATTGEHVLKSKVAGTVPVPRAKTNVAALRSYGTVERAGYF